MRAAWARVADVVRPAADGNYTLVAHPSFTNVVRRWRAIELRRADYLWHRAKRRVRW